MGARIYEATTVILVEHADLYTEYVRPTVSDTRPEARFKTVVQQITSRHFLEKIVAEFKLLDKQEEKPSLESAIRSLKRRIKVNVTGEIVTEAFSISYEDRDPVMAMKIANRLTALFIERNQQQREQHAQGTINFLVKELKRVQWLLKKQERKMAEFRARHYGMLPGNTQVVTTTTPADLTETEDIVVLYSQLRRLRLKYTDEHPEIIRLKAKIAESENKGETATSEGQSSQPKSEIATRRVEQNRLRVEQQWKELTLSYQVTQNEFQSLLDKKHQAELAVSMEEKQSGYRIQILDEARIPEAPSKPSLQQIFLAWLLLAMGAGVGLWLLRSVLIPRFTKLRSWRSLPNCPL